MELVLTILSICSVLFFLCVFSALYSLNGKVHRLEIQFCILQTKYNDEQSKEANFEILK